jgi:hypothetical protein
MPEMFEDRNDMLRETLIDFVLESSKTSLGLPGTYGDDESIT